MDNLGRIWERFHDERSIPLNKRFPGFYRAVVVETNDPLQFHRVRFKCPELHDSNLKAEQCPWAVPAPWLGGQGAGSWVSPCIGDIVWVTWEKGHPYGPIWVGFGDPTRRKFYPLESIFTQSPLAVKLDESPDEKPDDYLQPYLPKDYRPMANGFRDRYGNVEFNSSVGFFPKEHDEKPATTGQDAITKSETIKSGFSTGVKPILNDPDRKLMVRMTKYGIYVVQSDVGYHWQKPKEEDKKKGEKKGEKKEEESKLGEFRGDFEKDFDYEVERYKYLTKLLNEDEPTNSDQRRYEIRTRAGHKFEMRDVGWAQEGGGRAGSTDVGEAKSRKDDPSEARVLSKNTESDERWLKLRSKGGHLIQLMDTGFHPEKDNFYKRKLLEEIGAKHDGEEDDEWSKRDSRQLRFITRYGTKLVLDDRGSHTTKAELEETPRANGWLMKTRRSWEESSGAPRGYGFEANDKDELNASKWYSPKSKVIELNDGKDYAIMCTDTKGDVVRDWMGLKENEFTRKAVMVEDPEKDTYHIKLDKANGYIRFKTAGGRDNDRRSQPESFPSVEEEGINQGIEARDGRVGDDGAWLELVDLEERGLWFSKKHKLSILRSKDGSDQFLMIHSGDKKIVIRNNEQGPIQIYCAKDVEIIAGQNVAIKAGKKITFKAGQEVAFEAAGSGHAKLTGTAFITDVPVERGTAAQVFDPEIIMQEKIKPEDRGEVANGPYKEVEEKVITNYEKGEEDE